MRRSMLILDLFGCHLVDAIVCEEHDGTRDPEGNTRRNNSVNFVDNELAPVRMVGSVLKMLLRCIPS